MASHRHFLEHGAESIGGVAERGDGVSLQPGGVCHGRKGQDQEKESLDAHLLSSQAKRNESERTESSFYPLISDLLITRMIQGHELMIMM